jgi:hypothetical protein
MLNTQSLTLKVFRWAVRIIGLISTIYFLFWYTFFSIGSSLGDLPGQVTTNMISPVVFGLLVLVAYVLSWRYERFGGLLFVLAAAGTFVVGAVNGVRLGNGWFSFALFIRGWLYLGLPPLIAGVLFLMLSWVSQRHSASN